MGELDLELNGAVQAILARAADGDPDALYDLGLLYATGRDGVITDYVEAHKWFNLAALSGVDEAKVEREELARDMSRVEIAEAQKQARAWLQSLPA
ncbi:MAG: hypothetical protein AAF337_13165 [Pseudomonadota bacterium]